MFIPLKNLIGDNKRSMIFIYGGKVFVWDTKGKIWESSLIGAKELIGVCDLDGDGMKEVIISADNRIYILSGLNGKVLWSHVFPHRSSISRFATKIGPLGFA